MSQNITKLCQNPDFQELLQSTSEKIGSHLDNLRSIALPAPEHTRALAEALEQFSLPSPFDQISRLPTELLVELSGPMREVELRAQDLAPLLQAFQEVDSVETFLLADMIDPKRKVSNRYLAAAIASTRVEDSLRSERGTPLRTQRDIEYEDLLTELFSKAVLKQNLEVFDQAKFLTQQPLFRPFDPPPQTGQLKPWRSQQSRMRTLILFDEGGAWPTKKQLADSFAGQEGMPGYVTANDQRAWRRIRIAAGLTWLPESRSWQGETGGQF